MCGINGFTFAEAGLIAKMNELTKHRGPDQTSAVMLPRVTLGHNRLSIIDLSERANQPMWDEKRECVIIFNGEIYNFLALRRELEKKYHFRSDSDTEVILYAYKEYGINCLDKLNGIFALAIWDERTGELFLARDKMGVNPLYYYYDGNNLIFSSEIKAILAHGIPRAVDRQAFNLYFQLLYVPEPLTMFENIKKIPPASFLRWHAGSSPVLTKYWQVTDFSNLASLAEGVEAIKRLFPQIVKEQLVSDRPVGVFLSGGIDSSAVLGVVAENTTKGQVNTFSVGFKDSLDSAKFNADSSLAKQTAAWYGTKHTELMIGAEDIKNNLERIAWHLDEPNANPTAGAMLLLAEEAKKQVAVVLGGDGGDELFGGYPRYFYSRLITTYQRLPRLVQQIGTGVLSLGNQTKMLHALQTPPGAERVVLFLAQKEALLQQFLSPAVYAPSAATAYLNQRFFVDGELARRSDFKTDFEKYFMNTDRQSWLVDESLLRTNKMCLGVGLEPRVPVLDYRLVALSARLPTAWKFSLLGGSGRSFKGKSLWKEAVSAYLPAHIVVEKKRGWFTPMSKWMRGGLKSTVQDILAPSQLPAEFFDPAGVQCLLNDHLDGKAYHLSSLWAIVMWQLWYNTFIKK